MKYLLLLLLVVGCSTSPVKTPGTSPEVPVVVPYNTLKTPTFTSTGTLSPNYVEAESLIKKWGNSDEFMAFVMKKRTYFSHTTLSVKEAVELFRTQLDKADIVEISFYYNPSSSAIGGWNGYVIKENTKFNYAPIDRAAHLYHETAHKYGWKHEGNYKNQNDNVNSFPYAMGIDLGEFLELKSKQHLAVE